MLRRFSVSNFRSFRDEVVLDLTLTGRDKTQGFYHHSRKGNKSLYTSTAAGIFGSNGSGKSNILIALQIACNIATHSAWLIKPEDDLPVIPWFNSSRPCIFRLEWISETYLYYYELHLTCERIEGETLMRSSLSNPMQKEKLFIRNAEGISEASDPFKKLNNDLLRKNVSYLSFARQQGIEDEKTGSMSLMTPCPFESNHGRPPLFIHEHVAWTYLSDIFKHTDKKNLFLPWAIDILRECDTGISDINVDEEPEKTSESGRGSFKIYCTHETKNGKKSLDFKWESEGTRLLLFYLTYIFLCKYKGGILFLDEFDSALHPDAQRKILSFFKYEADFKNGLENPKKAQIIFTTHATQLMNSLGKAHIYLCEKRDNSSDIWRLDDMEGVKSSDNFARKYLGGQYGAVPL